jgi:predicted dehydrogenase
MSLGLCVLGCGGFAQTFAGSIRAFKEWGTGGQIELFFASRDRDRAREYCQRFEGTDFFGSYEEAAADPRVQALYVCTPHHLHAEHTLLAARYNKHVLVEKPMSRTLQEADRMISAARDAGVKLMVAENYRFLPMVQKAKELIGQGTIGTVRLIQVQEEVNYFFGGWRTDREMMGGGVLIDGGIHSVDLLVHLAGAPEEVYAANLPPKFHEIGGEDGIALMARLKGGATGIINHAWGISLDSWRLWTAISGTEGRIYFEPREAALTLETGDGKSAFEFPEDIRGIGHMVREFRDSISEDRPPVMSGEDGLIDLKVVLGAYQSAARNSPVAIEL